ncbi:MAG: CrcB family protein [Candidatus Marinamargulisbacteria bacterium]|jgi:fluoride exporter|nr:hypothetical protein [bacterium]MDG2265247.1 CrcB family protein [Candidatus Marinamargulisbacteria bacterium]|tara:strand:+ start:4076 stop:4417 length:342 start_codon:yes stop_codon:yes gene_type:complete
MIVGIALGGALGTLARYGLYCWINTPWMTLGINWAACLFIGFVFGLSESINSAYISWLSIGFLGAFSTFSTVSKDGFLFLNTGAYGTAILYIASNIIGGIIATAFGYYMVKYL